MAQCRREVGRTNSEEFLPWIEAIPMLRRERACRGNTFDVGKQQTPGSQRNDPLDVAHAQPGEFKGWQTRRHLSGGGHPEIGKGERRCHHDRERNDRKPHRPGRKNTLAKHE
jgi:hypothetical protein